MRILHITPYYEPAYVYGGPSRSIPGLCKALSSFGVDVTVFTTDASGSDRLQVPTGQLVMRDNVKVFYFRQDIVGERFFLSWALRNACWKQICDFDLVHIAGVWTYPVIPATMACRKFNIPYVISPRNSFMRWGYRDKWLKKRVYMLLGERRRMERAAAIHYTSQLETEESSHLGLRVPSFVVPNLIGLARFETLPSKGWLRKKLDLPQNAKIALFVGRLHKKKGLELSIPAIVSIKNRFPNLHFVIVGPDESGYLAQLQNLISKYKANDYIHTTGQFSWEECLLAYVDSDLFLLPSYSENFGNVIVEAMAAGLPVVVSEHVGMGKELVEARAGVMASLSISSIAQEIEYLLQNPEIRADMGRNSQKFVRRYNSKDIAAAMIDNYKRILSRR